MVNNQWCSDIEIVSTGCSPDLEHDQMPSLLSPEGVYIGLSHSFYIPPHADTIQALDKLYRVLDYGVVCASGQQH